MNDEELKKLAEKIREKKATKEEAGTFVAEMRSQLQKISTILKSKKKTK